MQRFYCCEGSWSISFWISLSRTSLAFFVSVSSFIWFSSSILRCWNCCSSSSFSWHLARLLKIETVLIYEIHFMIKYKYLFSKNFKFSLFILITLPSTNFRTCSRSLKESIFRSRKTSKNKGKNLGWKKNEKFSASCRYYFWQNLKFEYSYFDTFHYYFWHLRGNAKFDVWRTKK